VNECPHHIDFPDTLTTAPRRKSMRRLLVFAAFLLVNPAPLAAPVPKMKDKRPDAERFVGTWEAVSPAKKGQMWGQATWTIDDKMELRIAHPEEEGRFTTRAIKLDAEKTPKEIDIGGFKGIYEFDGDDIRVAHTSGDRPTNFDPKPGVDYHVLHKVEPKK